VIGWLHPIPEITRVLDLAGVFTCALLGGGMARAADLDLFGYVAVGTISGLGGGILRDTLLQHGPPVALVNYAYLPTALAGAFLAFLLDIRADRWPRVSTALDAAVIGFWAVASAQETLSAGLGWLPALWLGTIGAVGGGAIRDLLLHRIPEVFGGNALYATVAVIASGVYVTCAYLDAPSVGVVLGIVTALVLRILAVHRAWTLPHGLARGSLPPPASTFTVSRRARGEGGPLYRHLRRSSRREREDGPHGRPPEDGTP
jgi:uncharacterized membrane protein YeiH